MNATPLAPIAPAERIAALDVLRGFALVGILLMNMEAFAGPMVRALTGLDPTLTGVNRLTDGLIYFFVQGKFFTLFSLLFGMGFAMMVQRAEVAGRPFAGLYWRRSLALLGIGLAHSLLIWSGDILVPYALLDAVRREAALQAVAQPGRALADIGQALGFAEPAVFWRAFKRWTGCTPLQWRARQGMAGDEE